MSPDLDDTLVQKFPKIFRDRCASPQATAMCWGFACGDGWYWLIYQLCSLLQWDTDKNRRPQIVTAQVKEKFGRLCFYTESVTSEQRGMIRMVESMSASVCENCGSTKGVKQRGELWIRTRCENCEAAENGETQERQETA